jgi:hypothetical protein
MLSQEMDAETLKGYVRDKINEINERINTLQAMQTMLAGLLQTPQEAIHNYLQSFRHLDEG